MNSTFIKPFLSTALLMFVAMSIADIWSAFRKKPSSAQPKKFKRISQPIATAILVAVIALLLYWAWPSPEDLGLFAGAFLTIPVNALIRRIRPHGLFLRR